MAARAITRAYDEALRETGLRATQVSVLAAVGARGALSIKSLADSLEMDRTTLTRTVDRMQDAGWLERLADEEDMRITRLALTATGRKMFERIWPEASPS